MKAFPTLVLTALLAGCQTLPPEPMVEPELITEAQPSASYWLLKRQELCRLESDERRLRLREPAGDSNEGRLDKILMATCEPERTPGLLREALQDIPGQDDPALEALLDMIRDHSRSYGVLERLNAQLSEQLESTIEGIRRIEADMDHLRRNRRNP